MSARVRTSSLQRPMMQLNSTRMGNQPQTQRRSSSGIGRRSSSSASAPPSYNHSDIFLGRGGLKWKSGLVPSTWNSSGWSWTWRPQRRISRMASMLVSGYSGLHANSDRHLTQSCAQRPVKIVGNQQTIQSRGRGAHLKTVDHGGHVGDVELGDDLVDGLEGQLDDGLHAVRSRLFHNNNNNSQGG